LRLSNERDQDILKAGISDAAASLLEFMPTMGMGEAITFGDGVALPTRIKFDLLPKEALPKSTTALFSQNWVHDIQDDGFLAEVVSRWRHQTHNPAMFEAVAEEEPAAASSPRPQLTPMPAASAGRAAFGQQAAAPAGPPPGLRRPSWSPGQPAPAPPPPGQGGADSQSLAALIRQMKG
jgi:hypothetical protein